MPRTPAQQAFDLRKRPRHHAIRSQERNRTALLPRRRRFQRGKQRQQYKNRARKQDLPLEVAAVGLIAHHWIGLIGAHARRHTSCATSNAFSVVQLARQDAAVAKAPCASLQRLVAQQKSVSSRLPRSKNGRRIQRRTLRTQKLRRDPEVTENTTGYIPQHDILRATDT